jgi:foldase protein PrsA
MFVNKNAGRLVLACIFVFALMPIVFAEYGKTEAVVAKYDGNKEITESQYKNYLEVIKTVEPGTEMMIDAGNKEVLTQMLHYQVMTKYIAGQVKETAEMKKEAEKDFNQFQEFMKQQLGQDKELSQFYADNKVTEKEVRKFFLDEKKVMSYFSKEIPEAKKKKQYEEEKKQGMLTEADVRHILISTDNRSKAEAKKKAEALVEQLRKGADFVKIAKENSDDPGSKETGGLYQYNEMQPLGQTVEAYRKAAMTLPLNKISDPIETEYGYHIMRVEKRKEIPYDEVKAQITDSMAIQKENEFFGTKLKDIIKEEKIPDSMIKEEPNPPVPNEQAPAQKEQ